MAGVSNELIAVNVFGVPKKEDTAFVEFVFTKSKIAICCPVELLDAVGAVFTPNHDEFALRNAFFIDVSVACAYTVVAAFVELSPVVCVLNVFVPDQLLFEARSAVFLAAISFCMKAVVAIFVELSPAICVTAVLIPLQLFVVSKSKSIKD